MNKCDISRELHTITLNTEDIYYEISNLCNIVAEDLETQNVKLKRNLTDATTSNNRDIIFRLINDALDYIKTSLSTICKKIKRPEHYDDNDNITIYLLHSDDVDDNLIASTMHNYIVYRAAASYVMTTTTSQATISYQQIAADNLSTLVTLLYNDSYVNRDVHPAM